MGRDGKNMGGKKEKGNQKRGQKIALYHTAGSLSSSRKEAKPRKRIRGMRPFERKGGERHMRSSCRASRKRPKEGRETRI